MNDKAVCQTTDWSVHQGEHGIELNVYLNGRSDILGGSTERSPIAGSLAPEPGDHIASPGSSRRGGDLSFAIPTFSGTSTGLLSYRSGGGASVAGDDASGSSGS